MHLSMSVLENKENIPDTGHTVTRPINRDLSNFAVARRRDKHEEIIFSSIYNQERRDLIIIITILEYMHDEILRNRKPC